MRSLKRTIKKTLRPGIVWLEKGLGRINQRLMVDAQQRLTFQNIEEIKQATLDFVARMRIIRDGIFFGYRFSNSTDEPILYGTLSALLLKHLYGVENSSNQVELEKVVEYQGEDGLFRDPAIACPLAETEDWWGWRHLTLKALMTLALYNVPARKELFYLNQFLNKDRFRDYLNSRDWGRRVSFTSNELQNLGVMLQYARDYQNLQIADSLLEIMYEVIEKNQDPGTGLYGCRFHTSEELMEGVLAGYHFWLLYFYDKRPVPNAKRIIDSVLITQNLAGGFGLSWNSSACEDIDAVDPLVRFSQQTNYRCVEIKGALQRALSAIMQNFNRDGGWVFRRHEALKLPHPQMFSGVDESNIFYAWFRTLGLAYCLIGLGEHCPRSMRYNWQLVWVPGLQLAVNPDRQLFGETVAADKEVRPLSSPY
jgi:hypothetical protein